MVYKNVFLFCEPFFCLVLYCLLFACFLRDVCVLIKTNIIMLMCFLMLKIKINNSYQLGCLNSFCQIMFCE